MKKFSCFFLCFLFQMLPLMLLSENNTAYLHLSEEELKLKNDLINTLKQGNKAEYEEYLSQFPALIDALDLCKNGLSKRLAWDSQNSRYVLVKKEQVSKYGIGQLVFDYLKKTKTVVLFTKGFGSKSTTGGGEINGSCLEGEWANIGDGKEKYKVRNYNVIFISDDFKPSPAAISLILAHEVGHILADEYRANCPLPYGYTKETLKKPPFCYFPNFENDDDDMWCYPFEGMMAEELGITTLEEMNLYTGESVKIEHSAKIWYERIIGSMKIKFPRFYDRLRVNTCLQRKLEYLAKNHRCGMRCKYFDHYGYCDNPVKAPPCHLWQKHLETWLDN